MTRRSLMVIRSDMTASSIVGGIGGIFIPVAREEELMAVKEDLRSLSRSK